MKSALRKQKLKTAMADYKHDIFISYRNLPGVRDWVRVAFYKELVAKLSAVLAWQPTIFLDTHQEVGTWWNSHIPDALQHSKLLIIILIPAYEQSRWCRAELASIEEREKSLGRYQVPGQGLVVPVAYCKKELLSASACARQLAEFWEHAYSGEAFLRSERYLDFEDAMTKLANTIADLLTNQIPPWSPEWPVIDPTTLQIILPSPSGPPSL